MGRIGRLVIAATTGIVTGTPICVYVLAEGALRIGDRAEGPSAAAEATARATDSRCDDVEVLAADGVTLAGWLFTPQKCNDAVVLLLHGVGDSRTGMLGYARFLLASGFGVLAADSRGHGTSGGDVVTYGVKETADIHVWSEFVLRREPFRRLYGLGVSMGAANLLQALRGEPGFQAVVAESPFATFEEICYDRLRQHSRLPRAALWPLVNLAFGYTRLRYGVDLRCASPLDAVRQTQVPTLLIHGSRDTNIPPRHSAMLHRANPGATTVWMVEGASHVAVLGKCPEEYARRVVAWFEEHR